MEDAVSAGASLSSTDRADAAGDALGLPREPFDAFRAVARRGTTFYVDTPEGARGLLITRGEVVRDYVSFLLLPAIRVTNPANADTILRYRFNGAYSVRRR